VISWYQAARAGRASPCRYWPTCSEYAREAIEAHGPVRGVWLASRRLARCHPLGGQGVDLVPDRAGHSAQGAARALPPAQGAARALPPAQGAARALPPAQRAARALPPAQRAARALPPAQRAARAQGGRA
ncbi:MAG: membrane protein insertion efficiency factor YidD, partial [Acidimicrobiales bacterium]